MIMLAWITLKWSDYIHDCFYVVCVCFQALSMKCGEAKEEVS